jgi:aspartyl-tRNA(Asn)/glutamyl-tRNA(Gln) amidotransferase subunit B
VRDELEFEPVIGLEVHVQLNTRSKMFCACPADYQSAEPNTRVCPVCFALPGSLPVVNRQAFEDAMVIGLALNCSVSALTKFDRKNYPYPDLMKGYQISQYDRPLCTGGWLDVSGRDGAAPVRVRVNRVHMEEDVAKLVHIAGPDGGPGHTLMDVNRAGVPLIEIVSEPDIRASAQAEAYIESLQAVVRYLGVGTANMEEGSFRCDANVSIRPAGSTELRTKVEVKNMNRVRAVTRAIDYEVARQAAVYRDGGRVIQETRGWDDGRGETVPQRSKEQAHDYRYFPEPDIPPMKVPAEWVSRVRAQLPEMPEARRLRFQSEWGLSAYDAAVLTSSKEVSSYFEAVAVALSGGDSKASAKEAVNWVNGEVARLLKEDGRSISQIRVSPAQLASLVVKFQKRELNNSTAKAVFEEMYRTGKSADQVISEKGLTKVSDSGALGPIVEKVLAGSEAAVNDYVAGKETALRFLVGQVMKASKGQADPEVAASLLREQLAGRKGAR